MAAAYQNLFMDQGSTFTNQLNLSDSSGIPYNLTNYIINGSAKTSYYTPNTAIVFTSTILDANNGIVQLTANSSQTANVYGTLVYDVTLIDNNGNTTRVLEGIIYVNPGVTGITNINY